ncbi:MAG: HIT domain-containing protein [Deltaproteobacteria bacterium]|jgi:ATP adenylyltransferase|nr:HIT domain-containing protein [Deltaproteobacteria bacterium]
MKNLWAPWRVSYILGPKADKCVFCLEQDSSQDKERLVLYRGRRCFVIMNKYPYCNGHIMVAPLDHVACITELDAESSAEFMTLVQRCTNILREHFKAQGINIGINLGEAAGAGVREHLHCHLVPRWNGDSNFMAVMADLRTIPQHLDETYQALLPYFKTLHI